MASLNQITDAVDADRRLQAKLGEQEATFLMLALVVESGKRAELAGMTLGEFIVQVEAMVQEHRPA
jgi:hypothetical protein